MGKDNHNAGLHMIWYTWNNYSGYTDKYTEMIGEEMNKKKTLLSTKKEEKNTYNYNLVISPDKLFNTYNILMGNIMFRAIKYKLDISRILKKCEKIMQEDDRMNENKNELSRNGFPKLFFSSVFLSLIADELGCEVYELFKENKKQKRDLVYSLIEFINNDSDIYVAWEDEDNDDFDLSNTSFYVKSFDEIYGMAKNSEEEDIKDFEDIFNLRTMDLTFTKNTIKGENHYLINFGYDSINSETTKQYVTKSSFGYLYKETKGALADFIEGKISKIVKNGGS